jgi:hypothetical protein
MNFISFSMIFSALDAPIWRVKVFFGHQKQWSLPLNLAYLEHLNVIITIQFATQFATKEHIKDLTHTFYLRTHVTNYIKKELVFLYFHIKIQVPFWDELKKT